MYNRTLANGYFSSVLNLFTAFAIEILVRNFEVSIQEIFFFSVVLMATLAHLSTITNGYFSSILNLFTAFAMEILVRNFGVSIQEIIFFSVVLMKGFEFKHACQIAFQR